MKRIKKVKAGNELSPIYQIYADNRLCTLVYYYMFWDTKGELGGKWGDIDIATFWTQLECVYWSDN